jgi:hypothetical protein
MANSPLPLSLARNLCFLLLILSPVSPAALARPSWQKKGGAESSKQIVDDQAFLLSYPIFLYNSPPSSVSSRGEELRKSNNFRQGWRAKELKYTTRKARKPGHL